LINSDAVKRYSDVAKIIILMLYYFDDSYSGFIGLDWIGLLITYKM